MLGSAQLDYYAAAGPMTALEDDPATAGLPDDTAGIVRVVQGLLLHDAWAERYGVRIADDRRWEIGLRSASDMVRRIRQLDPARPLGEARPPERRLFGNCRHFTVLTCALLRRAGRPARARCGFGAYFERERHVDHWVVELWDDGAHRWRRLDAQIDEFQRRALELDFDPADLPEGQFLAGGEAWRLCRAGAADPDRFGVYDWWGRWMVRNNVVRDLAALNKVELLPWDSWGLMDHASAVGAGAEDALIDEVAALTAAGDWPAWRARYEADDRLRAPRDWPVPAELAGA